MGILTDIATEYDEQNEQLIIFAATRFDINTKSALNRLAGRASVGTGVGQRTLVASAYDKLGIDMVWREGPFSTMSPEEKYPKAKKIEYYSVPIDKASNFGDITNIPDSSIPRGKFADALSDAAELISPGDVFNDEAVLHIWKIPYSVTEP